jgi:hypothetical protein
VFANILRGPGGGQSGEAAAQGTLAWRWFPGSKNGKKADPAPPTTPAPPTPDS